MRRFLIIVVLVVAIVALSRLWFGDRRTADMGNATLDLVRGEGMARAGYTGEPPLAYADAARGLTGEAPEIARAVLQRMGVNRLEGVLTQPEALISELYARRFELIASGMAITPERCKRLLFSDPTHAVGESLLVRKGNPRELHSYADLAKGGVRVGIVTGSAQHTYAINTGVPAGYIRVVSSPSAGVASLVNGVIDAFAADVLTVQLLADQSNEVERPLPFVGPVVGGHEVKHYGAFGFRKNDKGLAREFNGLLKDFIGTPEHLALVRKFGITEDDLPPRDLTAKTLCRYGQPGPPQQVADSR